MATCCDARRSRPLAAFALRDAEEWSQDHSGAQIPKDVPLRCSVKLRQQTSLAGGFSEMR